ncbi:MAG: cupin domain-containing protein [Coriobacteriales bacterium]|nr:cupin domain-containing protein [Coriobacteriales bacterium]
MSKTMDRAEFEQMDVFGVGGPNPAAQYFTGETRLKVLTDEGCATPVYNVTFEPGCRNNWHVHHASQGGGQVLICTTGEGWYQEWGKPAVSLTPGTVITIPANVKHWHGAKADSWFSHVAVEVPGADGWNEWLEPVSCEVYDALV